MVEGKELKETVIPREMAESLGFNRYLLEKALKLAGSTLVNAAIKAVITKVEQSDAKKIERKKIVKINFDKGTIALVNLGFAWIDKQGKRQIYKTLINTEERKQELSTIRSKYGITRYDEKDKPIYMSAEGNAVPAPGTTTPKVATPEAPEAPTKPLPVQTSMTTPVKQVTPVVPQKQPATRI